MSVTEDQTGVIECLGAPATHNGAAVERIETHISIVFLAGSRAWKLKRAVRFDYIDASTSDRRRVLCEKEVQLNRRTAASLYVGVVAVTREADGSIGRGCRCLSSRRGAASRSRWNGRYALGRRRQCDWILGVWFQSV